MGFHSVAPSCFDGAFDRIGKEWMLITTAGATADGAHFVNAMTASWGGLGILWNRPVAFLFVRPQRYTYTLAEQAERFSLAFLGEEYRAALRLCGTVSGRNTDKLAAAGLTAVERDGVPIIAEATYNLICRKLYADDLKKASFLCPSLLDNYKADDFHRVYVVEIEEILEKDKT